ncbi:putative enoyl-CoA hydratase [Actinorhabdospora filicis]|uniref:3-hydroxyisobutyryl-CoA hydrolase n=1 Tax=Actinorhabdospora filicis TaxID=1785913 RepID=A0A9W6SMG3_9ACTN|nr:enoyl-CoA hydratase/isomerase family protein [Actinorhabdospora filicis]GLZ79630.1 putative enoyl-CoA hydratase [Actinorhabdospora filicis]
MVEFEPGRIGTGEVLYARHGALGRVRLNRPKAINALTHDMIRSMLAQLEDWAADDTVEAVAIEGAGERGLCAGGDVRAIREALLDGVGDPEAFWADEYRLNNLVDVYPKPFVAFMDGVTMGGGVGVSAHGSLRLATERSVIAMPETAIGFFPDVGGLYLLSRAPGETGTHLALTGLPVDGPGAVYCGLADAVVPSAEIPAIIERLAAGEPAGDFAPAPEAAIAADRAWIDECYAGDDPVAILDALRERHPATAAVLAARSPFSVAVTLAAIRRARDLDLPGVLAQDLRLGRAFAAGPDFAEGVRAVLVDRDNAPRWRPATLAEVDYDAVRALIS